ncbi:MAG TPA: hypothetical protein P5539_11190 [Mesotoga sp.]|nr:hypothetical protein [Mesotoga sp.]
MRRSIVETAASISAAIVFVVLCFTLHVEGFYPSLALAFSIFAISIAVFFLVRHSFRERKRQTCEEKQEWRDAA